MTTAPYNPRTPLVDESIADSQPEFLQNFGQLFNAFNLNHVSLSDPTNPGNHNVIQLTELNQGRETFLNEVSIYSKKVSDQTDQIFMRYPNNGKEFQLTQYQIYSIPLITSGESPNIITLQESYFSFLPGGIIVYFGRVNPNSNPFNIVLNPAICTNITGVNVCPIGTSTNTNRLFQPNVNVTGNDKFFTDVILSGSFSFINPSNQYYVIFGNI